MKGLLIKDLKLMKMQKKFVLAVVVMAMGMALFMENISFLIGYLTFIMPFYGLSTISYDEFDNGNAFLFTLPISRKLYVIEKYCFSVLLESASLLFGSVLSYIYALVKDVQGDYVQVIKAAPFVFSGGLVFLAIMLPLQLKLGAEKARVAVFIVVIVIFAGGYGFVKLLSLEVVNIDAIGLLQRLFEERIGILAAGVSVFAICAILLSRCWGQKPHNSTLKILHISQLSRQM